MRALGLAVAALAALLDQVSKLWVLQYFGESGCASRMMPVTSFFDFVLTCNRGVSFGFFNQPGQPALGEHRVGIQEVVGRHQLGVRPGRPAGLRQAASRPRRPCTFRA